MDVIIYLLIICVLWSVYYISLYIYYRRFNTKTKNYDSLAVIHIDCSNFTARYIYLVKVFYGKPRKKFFFLTTFLLEFFAVKDRTLLSAKIPPMVLFESQKEGFREERGKAKLMAFLLHTKRDLSVATEVRISHDCKAGDLFIYDIKLIDLVKRDIIGSLIQSWIHFLPTGTQPNAQIFTVNILGRNMTDIKPSPNPNFPEIALFFLLGIHWILFHTQYNINSLDKWLFAPMYESIETMIMTALWAPIFALVLTLILFAIYYLVIKRVFSSLKGIGFIWIVRILYLSFIVTISIMLGLASAFKPELKIPKFDSNDLNHSTYKWFALIIAIVIYSLVFFIIALICHWFEFFKDAEVYDIRSMNDKSFKSVKTTQADEETASNKSLLGTAISSSLDPKKVRSQLKIQSKRSEEIIKNKP